MVKHGIRITVSDLASTVPELKLFDIQGVNIVYFYTMGMELFLWYGISTDLQSPFCLVWHGSRDGENFHVGTNRPL